MIHWTGIGDEAGTPLNAQIKATLALGWQHLELRNAEVPGYPAGNVHDLPEPAFDLLVETLAAAGITASGLGSTIGNWASHITDPFEQTLEHHGVSPSSERSVRKSHYQPEGDRRRTWRLTLADL